MLRSDLPGWQLQTAVRRCCAFHNMHTPKAAAAAAAIIQRHPPGPLQPEAFFKRRSLKTLLPEGEVRAKEAGASKARLPDPREDRPPPKRRCFLPRQKAAYYRFLLRLVNKRPPPSPAERWKEGRKEGAAFCPVPGSAAGLASPRRRVCRSGSWLIAPRRFCRSSRSGGKLRKGVRAWLTSAAPAGRRAPSGQWGRGRASQATL